LVINVVPYAALRFLVRFCLEAIQGEAGELLDFRRIPFHVPQTTENGLFSPCQPIKSGAAGAALRAGALSVRAELNQERRRYSGSPEPGA
jgi:hypothetical protein